MPRVIRGDGQRVPVLVWARAIDPGTERQLALLASQPWVVDRVAAMADAHVSEGVAVGSVFATAREVVPAALGGDLGCGMSAIRLRRAGGVHDRRTLERVVEAWGERIPTGDDVHRGEGLPLPDAVARGALSTRSLERARDALGPRHLGTLGGGNHFVELDRDAEGSPWLLVHSGSRGLGGAVASHHGRAGGPARLAALDVETDAGAAYLADLAWATAFARENRAALTRAALAVLEEIAGAGDPDEPIDVPHNFVAREAWGGASLLVHRKGATLAHAGVRALIPGSMGTASYVVRGKGCEASFGSCSHGAGRIMTRREARARIPPRALEARMARVVFPRGAARRLVDESPDVYRDVREVLEDQEDLVAREVRLEPLCVLK